MTGTANVPSLVSLAVDALARNPHVFLSQPGSLGALGERLASLLLVAIAKRGGLTYDICAAFATSGHASVAAAVAELDLLAGLGATPSKFDACRPG